MDHTDSRKIECRTPAPGKSSTCITQWKYDAVRQAIREILSEHSEGIEFRRLPALVAQALDDEVKSNLGSVTWYTVTVKLHMEVIGELERITSAKCQHIRLIR